MNVAPLNPRDVTCEAYITLQNAGGLIPCPLSAIYRQVVTIGRHNEYSPQKKSTLT